MFNHISDEEAALFLSRSLTEKKTASLPKLKAAISGKPVRMQKCSETQESLLGIKFSDFTIVVAYGATAVLLDCELCLESFVPTSAAIPS